MAKFRLTLGIGYQNATRKETMEIPDEEIPTDPEQREEYINHIWDDWSSNYIEGGISEIKDE
jgi:hypothetical protein